MTITTAQLDYHTASALSDAAFAAHDEMHALFMAAPKSHKDALRKALAVTSAAADRAYDHFMACAARLA